MRDALLWLAQCDPTTREELQRAQERMRAIAEVFQFAEPQGELACSQRSQQEAGR
jgi:hypothetical protein